MLIEGRQVSIGLGSAHHVTLKDARDKAMRNYLAVQDGHDPRRKRISGMTFEQVTERAFTVLRANWKNSKNETQLRTLLANYAMPHIGRKAIDQVTPQDVLAFLEPLALEKPSTGRKVKSCLSLIFRWSVANGLRQGNPADQNIAAALPKSNGKHLDALPHAQVEAVIRTMQESGRWGADAVEFLVLTAARSGEVRGRHNTTPHAHRPASGTWKPLRGSHEWLYS